MPRAFLLLVIVGLATGAAGASPCRSNSWQPTYVHDLVHDDGVPYYVMPNGSFVALTGDWETQSGPGMCCLYGVRDRTGFTTCFEYTRIQCGCDLKSQVNDTCRRFLEMRGSTAQSAVGAAPAGFTRTRNAAIKGYNNRHLSGVSPAACARACLNETSFLCKSFDYYKNEQACDLSSKSAAEVGGLKTDYPGHPYDHYARNQLR